MSWSLSVGPVPAKEVKDKLEEELKHHLQYNPSSREVHVQEQITHAVKAAEEIIKAEIVGAADKTHQFHVTLSGHANPAHEPATGYSNDSVNISVSQA